MQFIPNDVATVGMGLAASMGQFLLVRRAPGQAVRPAARADHDAPAVRRHRGTASDIKIQAEQMLLHQEAAHRAAAPSTPARPSSRSSSDSDRDRWFTAEEAKEYGFIDHVVLADVSRRPSESRATVGLSEQLQSPSANERTSYGFRRIDPYAKLFEDRIIFVGTPISDDVANAVMAQLLCLQQMDPDRDIQLYINCPGGSFTAMTAIYDTMRYLKPDVQTVCLGQAASAAAVLLAAGTPGKRYALPNSRILIHQPYTEGTGGQISDLEIQANEIIRMRALLEEMIADSTGQTTEEVSRDIERDKILTAEQAVEYGLIDQVFDTLKTQPV